jgi:hypothetical protein
LSKHFKSRFPAANISRLNDTVATDTFFSEIAAHDNGIMGHGGTTMFQLYCGCKSLLIVGYATKTDDEIASTIENFICHHGAPNALFSDNAKAQIGRIVHEILRMYAIKIFQCKPHHHHQNSAARRIQEVKKMSNQLMDCTNTPPNLWLLCVNISTIFSTALLLRAFAGKRALRLPLDNSQISLLSLHFAGLSQSSSSHPAILLQAWSALVVSSVLLITKVML